MPCHHKIHSRANLVAKTFCGCVTSRCLLKLMDDIENDPEYHDGMLEFADVTRVEDFAVTATDLADFANMTVGLNFRRQKPTKKAILAGRGPGYVAAHGFCKMVEGTERYEVRVFEELPAAVSFLGISEDAVLCRSLVAGLKIN